VLGALVALIGLVGLVGLVACGPVVGPALPALPTLPAPLDRLVAVLRPLPAPPAAVGVTTEEGQPLAPDVWDVWTNEAGVRLSAALAGGDKTAALVPEVEFRAVDEPLVGEPTVTGEAGADGVVAPAMEDGRRYHWQIRARNLNGRAGPWTPFAGTLGYTTTPPEAPRFEPLPNDGYLGQRQVELRWQAAAGPAGIAGYAYSADHEAESAAAPPDVPNVTEPLAAVTLPEDGDWFFHVRAADTAGNWSAVTTVAIHVDTATLAFSGVSSTTAVRNAAYHPLSIAFTVSKPAQVSVTILNAGGGTVRTYDLGERQGKVALDWDGRDAPGALVAPGAYRFRLDAIDRTGQTVSQAYDGLRLSAKRIVVSLGQQRMTAFDGDTVILSTLVTTGGPELPTPVGTFQVLAKYTPFTFKSPWPKGSPYWYPDSPATYAVLFDWDGFFLHDAPWRTRFGPGSNTQNGTPGGDATGTHGCVNVPYAVQRAMFGWVDVGTPVIVQW
jgi:hypothetical protein